MTIEEIAEAITPTGYVAAIVGLLLCIAVILVRFRARNLALAAPRSPAASGETGAPSAHAAPVDTAVNPEPKSLFKAFSPEPSASDAGPTPDAEA